MPRSGPEVMILAVLASLCAFAYEDLGSLATAKEAYPHIFVPGEVNTVKIKNADCYVFSGQAERFLDDETDSELWQEATLAAKGRFLDWVTKGDAGSEVSMSSCSPLYREKVGKVYTVILSVPRSLVRVRKSAVPSREDAKCPSFSKSVQISCASPKPRGETLSRLRSYVADNPDDWRMRRELADLYFESGNASRGMRHYNAAVKTAIANPKADKIELAKLVYAAAQRSDEAGKDNLSLKYYRQVLHLNSTNEMRSNANMRIAKLLLGLKSPRGGCH